MVARAAGPTEDIRAGVAHTVGLDHAGVEAGDIEQVLAAIVVFRAQCRPAATEVIDIGPPAGPRLRIETEQVVDVERRIYLRAEDAIVVEADAFQRPKRVARVALEKRKIEDGHVFKLHEDVGAVKQALRISL